MGCGASVNKGENSNDGLLKQLQTVDPTTRYEDILETIFAMEASSVVIDDKAINDLLVEQSHTRDDGFGLGSESKDLETDVIRSGTSLLMVHNLAGVRITSATYSAALAATLARSDSQQFPPIMAQRLADAAKKDGIELQDNRMNFMIQLVLSEKNALLNSTLERGRAADRIIRWLRQQGVRIDQLSYNLCLSALMEEFAVQFPGEDASRVLQMMQEDSQTLSSELMNKLAGKLLDSSDKKTQGEKLLNWMRTQDVKIRPEMALKHEERQTATLTKITDSWRAEGPMSASPKGSPPPGPSRSPTVPKLGGDQFSEFNGVF